MATVGILFNGVPLLADATHHPNNTAGAPLIKSSEETLDPSCCCAALRCCCERAPPTPTLFISVNADSPCDCLDQTDLEFTDSASLGECDIGPGMGYSEDLNPGPCLTANLTYELTCIEDSSIDGMDVNILISGGSCTTITLPTTILSCNPIHILVTGQIPASEVACYCDGVGADPVNITVEITE